MKIRTNYPHGIAGGHAQRRDGGIRDKARAAGLFAVGAVATGAFAGIAVAVARAVCSWLRAAWGW